MVNIYFPVLYDTPKQKRKREREQQMATLNAIEKATETYAASRTVLRELAQDLEAEIATCKSVHVPDIKTAANKAQRDYDKLKALVGDTPEQFEKPRTITMHGIKVGFKKQKGVVAIDNPKQTIKLIKSKFGDDIEQLIKTKETPIKKALEKLSGLVLKSIGVSLSKDTDVVTISATDTEIDKFIDALFQEGNDKSDDNIAA